MTKAEKVIKGLECCGSLMDCAPCPYDGEDNGCFTILKGDALEMLKAQQPRVLTLEEVMKHYSLPPVFVDDLGMEEDYLQDIQPLYFEFPSNDPWNVHWRGYQHIRQYLDHWKPSYGQKWRCWTARPTEEQRDATPWDEPPKEEVDEDHV